MPLTINGKTYVMRLTLGALAELEAGLNEKSIVSLVERFEGQAFSSRDVLALLEAGLKGGRCDLPEGTLQHAEIAGGPMAAAKAAAELLARAFVVPQT
ncbi:Phage tail tube protein, GTA-gp10 [Roseobacter denitrificans OCh 114]|nr:Phage tail tube protein, GTA-gp10 [Roseobacter denitrificans OCh 114]